MAGEERNYDVRRFQRNYQLVRNVAGEVAALPPEIQATVKGIVRDAVAGTVGACKEIYHPDKEIIHPGSSSDWETDEKSLDALPDLFD
jgi:hypothetical protein